MPPSLEWSLPFRSSYQNCVCTSYLSDARATCPLFSPSFILSTY